MRIVIDMQGAQSESRYRGIGRYTLSFILAVVRNRAEHEIFLALNGLLAGTIEPIRAAFDGLLPQENIRVWYTPGSVSDLNPENSVRRDVAELVREAFLSSLEPDIIHITSLFEGFGDDAVTSIGRFNHDIPVTVTLYDLIPLLNSSEYLDKFQAYSDFYHRKIEYLRKADGFLCISEYAKSEGQLGLQVENSNFFNVSTAIEPKFQPIDVTSELEAELRSKFEISRSFVLYTGGADQRKNLVRLIEAYAALGIEIRSQHQLLFAGKMPEEIIADLKSYARSYGLQQDELCFTGYVSDQELVCLYNLCELYVFPSWHEGFGLPALEAMACGAPVIASNVTSLPEVVGLDEMLFEPMDVEQITGKMKAVLQSKELKNKFSSHGLEQAKNFSWDKTALLALTAFSKIAKERVNRSYNSKELIGHLTKAISKLENKQKLEPELIELAFDIDLSIQEKTSRQILVDVSEIIHRDARTGVQRVTRSILHQLLNSPPEEYTVEPVFAMPGEQGYRYADELIKNSIVDSDQLYKAPAITLKTGDIFLGLDLQHQTTIAQREFLQRARQLGVRVYFVVYDLLPLQFPKYWPADVSFKELHHNWLFTVSQFDGAVCISESVANELKTWFQESGPARLRQFDIKWFHLGADVENSSPSMGLPENANKVLDALDARPTFLSVGTIEPRKAQELLLEAFDKLWHQGTDVNLVFVGKKGWMVDSLVKKMLKHPERDKRFFWLAGVSDEYLEKVYAASTCLVAASEGEGFGLPLIEAAQHKLPIIARNIPVFREVAGPHAFYFDAKESEGLAAAIDNWIKLYNKSLHPTSEDMPWLTWEQSAQQLLSVLLGDKTKSHEVLSMKGILD